MKRLLVSLITLLSCSVLFGAHYSRDYFSDYRFFVKLRLSPEFAFFGDIAQQEKDSWWLTATYQDGSTVTGRPALSSLSVQAAFELLLHPFGINAGYAYVNTEEILRISGRGYKTIQYSGVFLAGHHVFTGLNYYFIDFRAAGFDFAPYAGLDAGYISAKLYPYPSLFNYFGYTQDTMPFFNMNGFSLSPRIGMKIVLNMFLLDFALFYKYQMLFADGSMSYYYKNMTTTADISVLGCDLGVGLAF